jgi:RND family efflux transporter MFP subunit
MELTSPFARRSLFLLSLAAPFLFAGCKKQAQEDTRTQIPSVLVSSVRHAPGFNREFTGTVTARVESDLGFRVPGKITKRLVDTGQTVHVGEVLLQMDRTDYVHAVTAQNKSVAAAKARAEQTAADEARYRGLVATGAASASTYDQIKAAADSARDQLAAAEAQARVASDEADYTNLVADADGIVIETLAEPGQVVNAGQTVIRIAHAGPREASISLPETMQRPRIGSLVRASLYNEPNTIFNARLRQLSDAADPRTRTFEARYVLEGDAAHAPLGETVTVSLDGGTMQQEALQIPITSVFDPGSGPGVWVVNPQKSSVAFRKVQIIRLGAEAAVITGGIQDGDEVVALAPHLLHEGETVHTETQKAVAQ